MHYYNKHQTKVQPYSSFSMNELKQFAGSKNEFWAVYSMLKYYDPNNDFKDYIEKRFAVEEEKEFIDVEVVKYKRYK